MRQLKGVVATVVLSISGASVSAADYVMDANTTNLADCSLAMGYMGNLALMRGNEGQARIFFLQYARAMAVLMAQNYHGGDVPKERKEAWRARSPAVKSLLDKNPARHNGIIDGCLGLIEESVNEPRVRNARMWGKSFNEVVEEFARGSRAQYGLK